MQMFPDETGFATVFPAAADAPVTLGNTLAFDDTKNRFVIADGAPVRRTDAEAVRQWIRLMLRTYRGRFRVYADTVFGHTGEDLIGMRQVPRGFIHSELAREIREACALCPVIQSADNFAFSRQGRTLTVTFDVTLTTGETEEVTGIVG